MINSCFADLGGLVWFYGISTIVGYLMPNPVFYISNMICKHILLIHTVKWFQVSLCITKNSILHKLFVCSQFKCKIVLFDLYRALSSGPGSNNNEGVIWIPQSSSITGTSSSDCLMSYPGNSLKRHSVLYTALSYWGVWCCPFIAINPKFILTRSCSTC